METDRLSQQEKKKSKKNREMQSTKIFIQESLQSKISQSID